MISRSIYNLNIDTVYTYDTPIESAFFKLSNGIRHVMPSADRRLELKAKDIDGSDRLTAGCVLIDLASPAVSRTAVYANGLRFISFRNIKSRVFSTLWLPYSGLSMLMGTSLMFELQKGLLQDTQKSQESSSRYVFIHHCLHWFSLLQ